jgi:hypothetical protein
MLATLAIAAALSLTPAQDKQDSQLKLSNAQITYGILGGPRDTNKFLPGDVLFLRFDISGLSVDKGGRIKYSLAMQMKNAAGETVFSQVPQVIEAVNTLGGSSLPAFAYADIGGSTAPGKYTLIVTVADEITKKKQELPHAFEVRKKDFGITRLGLFYDEQGRTWAPTIFVAGQSAWLHFWTVGFDRNPASKNADVEVRMRVLDDSGKPTLPNPVTGDTKAQKPPANAQFLPWFLKIELNRPGKYKIEVEATDVIAKKTAKEVLSITVLESKGK